MPSADDDRNVHGHGGATSVRGAAVHGGGALDVSKPLRNISGIRLLPLQYIICLNN